MSLFRVGHVLPMNADMFLLRSIRPSCALLRRERYQVVPTPSRRERELCNHHRRTLASRGLHALAKGEAHESDSRSKR